MVDVLAELHALVPVTTLWSHAEVGNHVSRSRNASVRAWCEASGVRSARLHDAASGSHAVRLARYVRPTESCP